jgi:UDP-glucose 4-epimerase
MNRTVLITGAGGFLPGHAARAFREAEWRVVGVGRNELRDGRAVYDGFQLNQLGDVASIANVLEKFTPALIVHLAAPASVPASLKYPVADFDAHVAPTIRLFDAVRTAAPATRVMLISSAAVYGEPRSLPIREDAELAPLSPYGFHKLHQELLCDEYRVVHGIASTKVRIFSTFGEGLRRLAVWDIARRAIAGDTTVLGTGDEVRDYLYAGDIGDALVAIANDAPFDGSAINVAAGAGTTIRQLAEKIIALAGGGAPRFTGVTGAAMPARWIADTAKLHALGFAPRHHLDDALARTVAWIRANA